jgi:hypothetical protein
MGFMEAVKMDGYIGINIAIIIGWYGGYYIATIVHRHGGLYTHNNGLSLRPEYSYYNGLVCNL